MAAAYFADMRLRLIVRVETHALRLGTAATSLKKG
jgi:hypothetical protein